MFTEACYRRNLHHIFKLKCSSVKIIHTKDYYQLFTNCPIHFAFTWLTGHKQQAPNLPWRCCHAMLVCHFALTAAHHSHSTSRGTGRSDGEVLVDCGHVKLTSWFQCTVILVLIHWGLHCYHSQNRSQFASTSLSCFIHAEYALYFPPIHSWQNGFHKALGK